MTRIHPLPRTLRPALAPVVVLLGAAAFVPFRAVAAPVLTLEPLGLAAASGRPIAVAAADFDEDGVPDLAVGTADGWLGLHPGRADAIWGFTPDALGRKAVGTFDARPFDPVATLVEIGRPAELVGTGDFDADGHADVVVGQMGAAHLGWLAGDGRGRLGPLVAIALPGVVTALAVDDVNRRDGLADVIVGVLSDHGAALLVFEGPDGAFAGPPEVIPLAGEVTDLATAWLDDHWARDVVAVAGSELVVVGGRDRALSRPSRGGVPQPPVHRVALTVPPTRLAVGDLTGDGRDDLAVLGLDAELRVLDGENLRRRLRGGDASGNQEPVVARRLGRLADPGARLVAARLTGRAESELVALSPLGISTVAADGTVTLAGASASAAVSLRLGPAAAPGLVTLVGDEVVTVRAIEGSTLTVDSTDDTGDVAAGDGLCDDGNGVCTLRAAIEEANVLAGTQTIAFAIPGAGPHVIQPATALPTVTDAVTIDGYTQPGAAQAAGPAPATILVELDGSTAPAGTDGLVLDGPASTVRGLAIHGFVFGFSGLPHGNGIVASSTGHVIEGNHLGTDAGGTTDLGNGGSGVFLEVGASTVGGTTSAARNVASGNVQAGISIWNFSDGNVVQGNYVGITADGTAALENTYGISLFAGANSAIGGTVAGAGNVLSGNHFDGLEIANPSFPIPTLVQGNLVGLDASGTAAIGNGSNGIGNNGTGATGAVGITVGGTTPTAGNTCSGNMWGIGYQGSDWLVQGNRIGTDLSGTAPLGNSRAGIFINHFTATGSTIGGTTASSANLIAYNNTSGLDSGGVVVNFNFAGVDPTANSVLGNSIFDNTGLGINLCTASPCDGATPNDPLDADIGPNGLQNFPVITSADAETGQFAGTLATTASTSYRVELFANHACDPSGHGEGELFLAAVDPVTTDGSGDAAFTDTTTPFLAGLELTATATAPDGSTSELSACFSATGEADLGVTKDDGKTLVMRGESLSYTIVAANPTGPAGAASVNVSDVLPPELVDCSWTCTPAGGATCAAGPVDGDLDDTIDLPVGGTATYEVTCTVDVAAAAGPLVNTVTLTPPAGVSDPVSGNDSATDTNTVVLVDFGDAPDPTYPTLLGSDGARHVVGALFLGAGVDDELDGQPTAGADGDDTDGGDDEDGVAFGQLLAGDAAATVDVTASAPGLLNAWIDFDGDGAWSAAERIFSDEPLAAGPNGLTFPVPLDAALGTTAARFRVDTGGGLTPTGFAADGEVEDLLVLVEAEADLSVAVTDAPDPVLAGEAVTYTVTVSSAGPSNAEAVVVQASVPAGATLVATSGCAEDPAGAPTCSLGTLGPGADVAYDLTVLVDSDRTTDLELAASVSSATTDPNAANDAAVETTTVVVETDLAVTGFSTPDPMIEGDQLIYTLLVDNLGPSDSTGSTLTLALPAGVVFVSATPGSPACEEAGGTVTCAVAALGAGVGTSFEIVVDVPVGMEGIISATAAVVADETDPAAGNDTVTVETTVLDDMTTIFVDGFESGDTSRWSATQP